MTDWIQQAMERGLSAMPIWLYTTFAHDDESSDITRDAFAGATRAMAEADAPAPILTGA